MKKVNPTAPLRSANQKESALVVSARDRYSSFLIAGIVIAGLLSGILILVFVLNIDPIRNPWQQIQVLKPLEMYQMTLAVNEEDFEEPDFSQASYGSDVEGYTDAVSNAISKTPALAGLVSESGVGPDTSGFDPRSKRDRPSPNTRPNDRQSRWALSFSLESRKEYLEQIDSLGIELGLLDKKSTRIDYAKNVAEKTVIRDDVRKNEKRFYFSTQAPRVAKWNRSVFEKSGLKTDDKLCLRFFPAEVIKRMAELESEYCKKEKLDPDKDLRQTLFGLKKTTEGWEIVLKKVRTYQ